MAQATEEEKSGSIKKTFGEISKASDNFETLGIEARHALSGYLEETSKHKMIAVCKFGLLKEANDIHHIVGSACLVQCQNSAVNAASHVMTERRNKKTSKNTYIPLWRVSGSTFIVIIRKSEKDQFKKRYKDIITAVWSDYDKTPSYKSYVNIYFITILSIAICDTFLRKLFLNSK